MKYLIGLLVFLVMVPTSFVSAGKVSGKVFGKISGKTGKNVTRVAEDIRRKVHSLMNEKPVSEIIRELSDEYEISAEDVFASLYRSAWGSSYYYLDSLSGQRLENVREIMKSMSIAFDDGPERLVKIGDLELITTIPADLKKIKIGDFEFEIKDVFSSPLLFGEVLSKDWRIAKYVLMNLSDFVDEEGAKILVRLWDNNSILQRDLHLALEKYHLIGNPELVLKWFQLAVPEGYLEFFNMRFAIERGIEKLHDFIVSEDLSRQETDFMKTILAATRENDDFLKHVNILISWKRANLEAPGPIG